MPCSGSGEDSYAGDDPVNNSDPAGLCTSLFGLVCVGSGPVTQTLHFQFHPVDGLKGGANFIEGFGNSELGTINTVVHYGTFGNVNLNLHISPLPFGSCNPFVTSDYYAGQNVGTIFGFVPGNPAADLAATSIYAGILKYRFFG
jgi:hypothetical protein